jgi:hypothetical protein
MKRSSPQQLQSWVTFSRRNTTLAEKRVRALRKLLFSVLELLLALGGAGMRSRPMLSQLSTAVMLRNIPNKACRSASRLNYCLSSGQVLSFWGAVCPSMLVLGKSALESTISCTFRIDFSNNCKQVHPSQIYCIIFN